MTTSPVRLSKYQDLPRHLQFNRYVLDGYRPLLTTRQCVDSLCYLHNESFNVFTHVFSLLYSVLTIYEYSDAWNGATEWSIASAFTILHYLISALPFALSIAYHVFMCHKGGANVYHRLLSVDVFAIWLLATFGTLPVMYCTFYCSVWVRGGVMWSYMVCSLILLLPLVCARDMKTRVLAFLLQFVYRIAALSVRFTSYGRGHPQALKYYILLELSCAVGVVVNGLHVPERWLPGSFDYFNGHTIMHIIGFIAVINGRQGFLHDMTWLNSGPQCLAP